MTVGQHSPRSAKSVICTSGGITAATCRSIQRTSLGIGIGGLAVYGDGPADPGFPRPKGASPLRASLVPAYTQCISRPMPRIEQSYNHGIEILQSPGYVVIFYESMHNARIIPLDGSPHLPSNVRLWDGDSRGRWEGNTLVVDWTNFDPRQEARVGGAQQGNVHYIERFTRVDEKTVNETVTVDDPTTWTKTWTYVLPWRADDKNYQHPEDLYEYACHEGNYRQMENALAGSRAIETAAKSAK